jgi:hypothetical protein
LSIAAANVGFIDTEFDKRLGDPYEYGEHFEPDPDTEQSTDCSGLVGWVLEGYTKGPEYMSWSHVVSTESWFYDYGNDSPASVGSVGPYGTIAIARPEDQPATSALLITIMHGGGGEDSHMACSTGPAITPTPLAAPAGKIMESNGDAGVCTNNTGGTPIDSNIWTDFWYLPGPIVGDYTPPPAPPAPASQTYTVRPGDTLDGIARQFNVTVAYLIGANPSITDPNVIDVGQVIVIP